MIAVAPSAPPEGLQILTTTLNSIAVTWNRVPCVDRNIAITGYQWRWSLMSDPTVTVGGIVTGTGTDDRTVTFPNLIPRSNYTIEVRAVHTDFTVIPPVILSSPAAEITAGTAVPTGKLFFPLFCFALAN